MEMQAIAQRQQNYVRISKDRLIQQLKKNREVHQEEWEKAVRGWRSAMVTALEDYSAKCLTLASELSKDDKMDKISIPPQKFPHYPQNHVSRYNEIIERLDFDLDEEIYLTHSDFNRYVRDNWEWKEDFIANSSMYVKR